MPQFDILTIGAQVFGLLVTLLLFYYLSIKTFIPLFVEIKKLRIKKLNHNSQLVLSIDNDLKNSVTLLETSYEKFLSSKKI